MFSAEMCMRQHSQPSHQVLEQHRKNLREWQLCQFLQRPERHVLLEKMGVNDFGSGVAKFR